AHALGHLAVAALAGAFFAGIPAVEVVLAAVADDHLAVLGDLDPLGDGFLGLGFHSAQILLLSDDSCQLPIGVLDGLFDEKTEFFAKFGQKRFDDGLGGVGMAFFAAAQDD